MLFGIFFEIQNDLEFCYMWNWYTGIALQPKFELQNISNVYHPHIHAFTVRTVR